MTLLISFKSYQNYSPHLVQSPFAEVTTMPTFYPRTMSQQLPPTPPEYLIHYDGKMNGDMQQHRKSCHQLSTGLGWVGDGFTEYGNRYTQSIGYEMSKAGFPVPGNYVGVPHFDMLYGNRQYNMMELPSMPERSEDLSNQRSSVSQFRQQKDFSQPIEAANEDKIIGGVSAKLDYDMERMTDFVCEMSQGMYAILQSHICIADVDIVRSIQPGCSINPTFRKWVSQVLCSTRLPSATILLSLHYLSIRMRKLSDGAGSYRAADGQIYRLLTLALLLGSKFLDDNTFINRSWSEVSGIKVAELNRLETEWLIAIKFDLHLDPREAQGFGTWQAQWQRYNAQVITAPANKVTDLMPLDTRAVQHNISHQHSGPIYPQVYHHSYMDYPTEARQPQYKFPSFAQYDGWNGSQPANDTSPASASHSGPTTPDYYSGANVWGHANAFTPSTSFGFYSSQNARVHSNYVTQSTYTPTFQRQVCNGLNICGNCFNCRPGVASYLFGQGHAPQTVAG